MKIAAKKFLEELSLLHIPGNQVWWCSHPSHLEIPEPANIVFLLALQE